MNTVGIICLVMLGLTGVLSIIRIVRGPTMLDRTVASDVFTSATLAAIGIEAAISRHTYTLPILLGVSMLAFMGSVSIARFAAREPGEQR